MASKKTKATPAADDNFDDLFEGIGDETKSKKATTTGKSTTSKASAGTGGSKAKGADPLADLESELASEQTSRPHTPRLKDHAGGARRSTATPPETDDKTTAPPRKSTDSARSLRTATFTPSATSSELHDSERKGTVEQQQQQAAAEEAQQAGNSWWGGIFTTATATANAAMKQAGAAYKEIQQNEEAKKWADQVKGLSGGIDVGALRHYGRSSPLFVAQTDLSIPSM